MSFVVIKFPLSKVSEDRFTRSNESMMLLRKTIAVSSETSLLFEPSVSDRDQVS